MLYGIENIEVFLFTAFIFIITPGIDTVFVLNKSISQGKKAGIYSSLGINGGILIHTLFASLGLSLIIAKSATAFMILKYVGALYLIYMGIMSFKNNRKIDIKTTKKQELSNKKHFLSGLITNTLNPKVALFFMVFFPQFITKSSIENPIPFIILGIIYAFIGIVWFLILTYFSSIFAIKLRGNKIFNSWLNKISGGVYILMGVKTALTKK